MDKLSLQDRIDEVKNTAKYHGDYSLALVCQAKLEAGKEKECLILLKKAGF